MPNDDPKQQANPVDQFIRLLTPEERMLVVLKRELYDDNWEAMTNDLASRLAGGPYVFRLASRIEDDLNRIARLRDFEEKSGANLADYIEP